MVMVRMGRRAGFEANEFESYSLANSVGRWRPFADTTDSLRKLKSRYRLMVISNVDDDMFAKTQALIEVPFDMTITSQQAGSYKPSLNNFHAAFDLAGVSRDKILHVAESLFHDIGPANELGLTSVWVNRHKNGESAGATRLTCATPNLEVPDLQSLLAKIESG